MYFLIRVIYGENCIRFYTGQEMEIKKLANRFYTDIFPLYFSDDEICRFEQTNVLNVPDAKANYNGTLREACEVIASLQILISILETAKPRPNYEWIFYHNAQTLNDYGIYFPFQYSQFTEKKTMGKDIFSMYVKPANEWLI